MDATWYQIKLLQIYLHEEHIDDHSISNTRDDHKGNIQKAEQIMQIRCRSPELPPIRVNVHFWRSIPSVEPILCAPHRWPFILHEVRQGLVRRSVQHLPTVLQGRGKKLTTFVNWYELFKVRLLFNGFTDLKEVWWYLDINHQNLRRHKEYH